MKGKDNSKKCSIGKTDEQQSVEDLKVSAPLSIKEMRMNRGAKGKNKAQSSYGCTAICTSTCHHGCVIHF